MTMIISRIAVMIALLATPGLLTGGMAAAQPQRIHDLTQESDPGCGSCTIDALYLQGERFNRYIPLLFSRVDTSQ